MCVEWEQIQTWSKLIARWREVTSLLLSGARRFTSRAARTHLWWGLRIRLRTPSFIAWLWIFGARSSAQTMIALHACFSYVGQPLSRPVVGSSSAILSRPSVSPFMQAAANNGPSAVASLDEQAKMKEILEATARQDAAIQAMSKDVASLTTELQGVADEIN